MAEAAAKIESGELNPDFVHARIAWDAATDTALDNLNVAGYQRRGVLERARDKHLALLLESAPRSLGSCGVLVGLAAYADMLDLPTAAH